MENNEKQTKKTTKEETFLKICENVKRCKALDWIERIILSNYISFQRNGQEFYQTDLYQAKELGLSAAQISKYTGRLKEREIIETTIDYIVNPSGGRPIPKRYVKVIDLDKWTEGKVVPDVKKITSASQKRKANKIMGLPNITKNDVNVTDFLNGIKEEEFLDNSIIQEAPLTIPIKQINNETSLEEDPAELEKITLNKTQSTIPNREEDDLLILDAFRDIEHSCSMGEQLLKKEQEGMVLEFIKASLKFDDNEILDGEVFKLESGKYYLKNTLNEIRKKSSQSPC
jgi:hypothetical protein